MNSCGTLRTLAGSLGAVATKIDKILLGPITCDPAESVGMVNESLMSMLRPHYSFAPHVATRRSGGTTAGMLNMGNCLIFIRHLYGWIRLLYGESPRIAHYAITSNWNMEKSLFLLWLAQVKGCKTVGHLHGGLFIEFWKSAHPARRRLAMHVISRLDAFVVLSEGWKDRVVNTLGLRPDQVHVVHNSIDSRFEEVASCFQITRQTNLTVLCFGVMDSKKGVFDILDAAALLPPEMEIRFILVGPEREPGIAAQVQALIKDKGLEMRMELTGPVQGERKLELFQQASLFLLPSYVENFPVTVLEAMAAGLPVICTPVGAVPEFLVDRISGWFVEPGSPCGIASAVQYLMSSPVDRHHLATIARGIFEMKLQRTKISAQMMSVYDNL